MTITLKEGIMMALELKLVAVVVVGLIMSVGGYLGSAPDEPEVDVNEPVSRVAPAHGLYYLWTEPVPGANIQKVRPQDQYETGLLEPVPSMDSQVLFNGDGVVIQWAGTDGPGTGIAHFDVQVMVDDGEWTDWKVQTTDMEAMYYPDDEGTYYFRCRATDNAGNVEEYPDDADARFQVKVIRPGDIVPFPEVPEPNPDHPDVPSDPWWWYCPPGMVCALDDE
jgi:hypothetical protein